MRSTLRTISLILLAGISFCANGQLTCSGTLTPAQLVQNVLVGGGVQAFNVTYNGIPSPSTPQLGTASFTAINTNLGLGAGVILGSGIATNSGGPESFGMSDFNNTGSDPDLVEISGGAINDKAVLEFDFIPAGDTLKFRYVFGSEEYPEFVCSFNDVFGFFLSGPGISGPYSNNAINIATVPGTALPVGISTINFGSNDVPNDPFCPAVNPAYYVNNNAGLTVIYDAFTRVLVAKAVVSCGQVYHIKLAIGDALDTAVDSGVFLEANSFTSTGVLMSSEVDFGGQDSTLYEGCGEATMILSRGGVITQPQTVQFITQGQAVSGVDYTNMPGSFTFGPGEDTIVVTVNAFFDALVEGSELAELLAIYTGPCGLDTTFLRFMITDAPPIILEMSDDVTLTCPGDSTFITGEATGGYGVLTLDWNTGPADGTTGAWVTPAATTTYVLTVTDECGVITEIGDVTVVVPIPAPLVVAALPDTTVLCPEVSVNLNTVVVGGTAPYIYQWTGGLGNAPQATVAPPVTQSWTVTVTDVCGMDTSDQLTVTVVYDTIQVFIAPDTTICRGDTAFLVAYASLGTGAYTYEWSDGWTDPVYDVMPYQTSGYSVTVTDECNISATDNTMVFVNDPSAQFMHHAQDYMVGQPIQFIDQSVGGITWHWDLGFEDFESEEQYPSIIYPEEGVYTVMLTITDELGCVDSTFQLLFIDPEAFFYLPTAFTPDGDGINETFGISGTGIDEFEMRIFDRWGELVFSSNHPEQRWDGTFGGEVAKTGVYVVWFRLQDRLDVVHEHRSQVTLLK